MKNIKFLSLILVLTIFSCNEIKEIKKVEEVKTSNNSNNSNNKVAKNPFEIEISQTPFTPLPTAIPSIKPDTTGLEVYGEGIFCEKRSNIKVKLDKPVNIAVTRDGSTIYAVNGKCGRKPYLKTINSELYNNYCHYDDFYKYSSYFSEKRGVNIDRREIKTNRKNDFEFDIYSDIVENNPIFKITDKKVNLVYGDNSNVFYCSNDGVLALDSLNNLYFSSNRRIFKVINEKEIKNIYYLDSLEKENNLYSSNLMIRKILIENDSIFFSIGKTTIPKRIYLDLIPIFEKELNSGINVDTFRYEYFAPIINIELYKNYLDYTRVGLIKNTYMKYISNLIDDLFNSNFFAIQNDSLISNKFYCTTDDYFFYDYSEKNLLSINYKTSNYQDNFLNKENIITFDSWKKYVGIENQFPNFDNIYKNFYDIKINSKGEYFFNEIGKHRIWKVDKDKNVTIFVGNLNGLGGYKDGASFEALLNFPSGMSFDANDNLYVADTGNNAIRKITPDGVVSTFYKEDS
ncbi:MAG: hypothetical protein U0457_05740 [Candidatus Sericytochromatia bacterium]